MNNQTKKKVLKKLNFNDTPPWWYNEESQRMLSGGYLLRGETLEDAVNRITNRIGECLHNPEIGYKLKNAIHKGWVSLSSPIWANLGTKRGLPISCFNVSVPDTIIGITDKLGEVIRQTSLGG
jgi:ribonucleoside-diphosphate reductase alpha chain